MKIIQAKDDNDEVDQALGNEVHLNQRTKMWTRVFQRASPLDGRDSLFLLCWKTIQKNGLESPLIFVLF